MEALGCIFAGMLLAYFFKPEKLGEDIARSSHGYKTKMKDLEDE